MVQVFLDWRGPYIFLWDLNKILALDAIACDLIVDYLSTSPETADSDRQLCEL